MFGDIVDVLEQHFERLSDAEREIVKWLAIDHKPASFSRLRETISPNISPPILLEALESLEARCLIDKPTPVLIEKKTALFAVQPVIREYITDQLVEAKISEAP